MSSPEETAFPSETASEHSSQTHIHAPQPINSAAMSRLQAILELCETPLDNGSIAASDVTPQVNPSNLGLGSGGLDIINSDIPSHDVVESKDDAESPIIPFSSTINQDEINVELQEDMTLTPEQVTFWPVLERYLDHPTLPCPEPWCAVCRNVMLVLSLDQFAREDLSIDYEKCIVLLCGHLIGSRCFDELTSKQLQSDGEWQDEYRELWVKPAACPICRMKLSCRRCGLLYESARLPASTEDEWEDVSLILIGSADPPEFCEDCSAHLEV